MAREQEPFVNLYELSGLRPFSPPCWSVRFVLNYKKISYKIIKVGFPAIEPTCKKLFGTTPGIEATVPIIEILKNDTWKYEVLNDSIPITELLNARFSAKDGFREVCGLEKIKEYEEKTGLVMRGIIRWIAYDLYLNAVDPDDGSKEFFKRTREEFTGCDLQDITELRGGGEEACLKEIKVAWLPLQERMQDDDENDEPTYLDFRDAGIVKWIQAASEFKFAKLVDLYADDTFLKLMKKVETYSQ